MSKRILASFLIILMSLTFSQNSYSYELDSLIDEFRNGDFSNVETKLKDLAESGDARAQFNLGVSYFHGNGVAKDYNKAFYWTERAAKNGDIRAEMNLANYYYKGVGTEVSYSKAKPLFEKSAEKGNPFAQVTLGNFYKHGLGVKIDLDKAFECYDLAASKGLADASFYKAEMLLAGEGVEQDVIQAIYIFDGLGKSGYYPAQMQLAKIYSNDDYGQKSEGDYKLWLTLAENNEEKFHRKSDDFGKRISADNIKKDQLAKQDLDSEIERSSLNDLVTASQ